MNYYDCKSIRFSVPPFLETVLIVGKNSDYYHDLKLFTHLLNMLSNEVSKALLFKVKMRLNWTRSEGLQPSGDVACKTSLDKNRATIQTQSSPSEVTEQLAKFATG